MIVPTTGKSRHVAQPGADKADIATPNRNGSSTECRRSQPALKWCTLQRPSERALLLSARNVSAGHRYTAYGVLFGLAFPLGCIAFLGALGRFHPDQGLHQALAQIHAENVLLYVVDSAPIFLGLFARFAGVRQDKIERFNELLEQQIEEKTRNLWSALEDARSAHQTVLHMAQHDALTGLANRSLLRQRIDQVIVHAQARGQQAALVFLDLDGFKTINDSLGHEAGDRLLCEVAARLAQGVRADDTVARLGGDEFVVLLADLGHGCDIATAVRKLQIAVAEPMTICHRWVSVTASFGFSVYPDQGETGDALMRAADLAMYRVKATGKNNVQTVDGTVQAATERRPLELVQRRAQRSEASPV